MLSPNPSISQLAQFRCGQRQREGLRAASSLLCVTIVSAPTRWPQSDSDFENEVETHMARQASAKRRTGYFRFGSGFITAAYGTSRWICSLAQCNCGGQEPARSGHSLIAKVREMNVSSTPDSRRLRSETEFPFGHGQPLFVEEEQFRLWHLNGQSQTRLEYPLLGASCVLKIGSVVAKPLPRDHYIRSVKTIALMVLLRLRCSHEDAGPECHFPKSAQ